MPPAGSLYPSYLAARSRILLAATTALAVAKLEGEAREGLELATAVATVGRTGRAVTPASPPATSAVDSSGGGRAPRR